VFGGQPAHYGEDGGADGGEFGVDVQMKKFEKLKMKWRVKLTAT
jgi:hypothetical protein